MQIGRKMNNRVLIPNNRGTVFHRAQAQVEEHAKAYAEKYNTSLNVDGPKMLFWTNNNGAIPCSCRATASDQIGSDVVDISEEDLTDTTIATKISIAAKNSVESGLRKMKVGIMGTDVKSKPISSFFEGSPESKVTAKQHILSEDIDEFIVSGEYEEEDILDAMSDDPVTTITDAQDPFNLFTDKLIDCPICLGTGFIDAWQPIGGQRIVLDTSNAYNFFCSDTTIDDTVNPTVMTMEPNQPIQWTVKLPLVWDEIVRLNIYHKTQLISPEWYTWTWSIPALNMSGTVDIDSLIDLLEVDSPISITLMPLAEFPFTHAEMIFMHSPLVRGQVPEMPQAYEDEFDTWQASVTMELPTNVVELQEGDYLTEAKYNRVWKVNSINYKKTTGNTLYGVSVDVRALHRFESIFYQLNVFRGTTFGKISSKYP